MWTWNMNVIFVIIIIIKFHCMSRILARVSPQKAQYARSIRHNYAFFTRSLCRAFGLSTRKKGLENKKIFRVKVPEAIDIMIRKRNERMREGKKRTMRLNESHVSRAIRRHFSCCLVALFAKLIARVCFNDIFFIIPSTRFDMCDEAESGGFFECTIHDCRSTAQTTSA